MASPEPRTLVRAFVECRRKMVGRDSRGIAVGKSDWNWNYCKGSLDILVIHRKWGLRGGLHDTSIWGGCGGGFLEVGTREGKQVLLGDAAQVFSFGHIRFKVPVRQPNGDAM